MRRTQLGLLGGAAMAVALAGVVGAGQASTAPGAGDRALLPAAATSGPSGGPTPSPDASASAGPATTSTPTASPSADPAARVTVLPVPSPSATTTPPPLVPGPRISLRVVTYNTLGSLHTEPGGDREYLLPAELRAQLGADLLRTQRPDIVGFQELRPVQIATFRREFPTFGFWPDTAIGTLGRPITLMWDDARLARLDGGYVTIPYMGVTRRAPWVLLQDRATGRRFYYVNVHNSPGPRQAERDQDLVLETAQVRTLRATGLPVLIGGDFNEHEKALCTMLAQTDLASAQGGSVTGGLCTPPTGMRIDQIFGNATFSGYVKLQPPLVQRATDHAIVAATATLN